MNFSAAHALGMVFEDWPFSIEETDRAIDALNKAFPDFSWEAGIPTDSGDYRVGVTALQESGKLTDQVEISSDEAEKIVALVNEQRFSLHNLSTIEKTLGILFPTFKWVVVSSSWSNRLNCTPTTG